MAVNPNVARWFLDRRGITTETLAAFNVEQDGVRSDLPVIKLPYPGATKYRKGLEKEGREFWWDPPDKHGQAMFTPPNATGGKKMLLVEGETDTMCLWQNAPAAVKQLVRGLPGTESWKPHFADDFADAELIYVIMDNDDPYENADAAESGNRGFKKIKASLGAHRVRRVFLPQGINDVCDFFSRYGWPAFKVLLDQALDVKLPFQRLDLAGPVPEYDWLVQDLIAKGDVVMVAGDPGVGKSWLTLDLALAVAGLREEWLGMPVLDHGPVVIVDQENPQVTARKRLALLGMPGGKSAVADDLHYLWYQGVRLDTQAELLFEYCEIVRPRLLILDSISRMHFKNENSAEDMNPLMNGGIYPIARELETTVILIHHLAKHGGARGSTALPAATDLNLSVRHQLTGKGEKAHETGLQWVQPDKLRNTPPWGESLLTRRVQMEDGGVRLWVEDARDEEAY